LITPIKKTLKKLQNTDLNKIIKDIDDGKIGVVSDLIALNLQEKSKIFAGLLKKIKEGKKLTVDENKQYQSISKELEKCRELENKGKGLKFNDAASYVGCSKRTLSIAIKKGKLRQEPNGDFLIDELNNYISSNKGKSSVEDEDYEGKKSKADFTLKELKAKREAFVLKKLQGKYVDLEVVYDEWVLRVQELTAFLLSWPNSLTPILANKDKIEIKNILDKEVKSVLNRYSREGKWTPTLQEYLDMKLAEEPNGRVENG
jgi:hypothetical protein